MPGKLKKSKIKAKPKAPRITVEEVEETPKEVSGEKLEETVEVESPNISSFKEMSETEPVEEVKATEEKEESPKEEHEKETPESHGEEGHEMKSSEDVKEWLKDIRPDTTKDVEKSGGGFNGKLFFGLLVVFILLGALAGGLFYYKQRVSPTQMTKTAMEEPTAAPTATPTPEPVDLTSYSVNVLNGSGVAGQAGVVKDLLVAEGFVSDNFKTGNASTYDYENTEVQVKAAVPETVTAAITKALEGSYTVDVASDNLKDSSNYDIVVTVGTKK